MLQLMGVILVVALAAAEGEAKVGKGVFGTTAGGAQVDRERRRIERRVEHVLDEGGAVSYTHLTLPTNREV